MDDVEQSKLGNKFLRVIRDWLNYIIPEETRNCIRSKIGIIVDRNENKTITIKQYNSQGQIVEVTKRAYITGTYNVIVTENLQEYYRIANQYGIDLTKPISTRRQSSGYAEFLEAIEHISIDNLYVIKTENPNYAIDDYVVIGYLDNKLTNAFILCKNKNNG